MLKQCCQLAPDKNWPQRLRDAYLGDQDVQKIVRCLFSLPLLPTGESASRHTVSNIRPEVADDGQHVEGLKKLVAYINKQWINKCSVGPERLSVTVQYVTTVVSH